MSAAYSPVGGGLIETKSGYWCSVAAAAAKCCLITFLTKCSMIVCNGYDTATHTSNKAGGGGAGQAAQQNTPRFVFGNILFDINIHLPNITCLKQSGGAALGQAGRSAILDQNNDGQAAGRPHSQPARLDTNGNNLTFWLSETMSCVPH